MRQELDPDVFETKMTNFLQFLESDSDHHKFKDYFKRTYVCRSSEWAYAHLPMYGGYNTNMYLESWHAEFKHNYLNGIPQRRLDFVLHQLKQFDKDEQEEEIRRSIFGRRRNKRSAKVLKCHKLADKEQKEHKYNIKCGPLEDGQPSFVFTNEKTPSVMTNVYIHVRNVTCIHRHLCSCEDRRIRRDYCVHLCAMGQHKRLLLDFDQRENQEAKQPEEAFDLGEMEFGFDVSDDLGGYQTDDAPEIEATLNEIGHHSKLVKIACQPEQTTHQPTSLEKASNLIKEIQVEVIHALKVQPDRSQEFLDQLKQFHKRFKMMKYSNINEISEFETEKSRKRTLEKQPRRSPRKSRRTH